MSLSVWASELSTALRQWGGGGGEREERERERARVRAGSQAAASEDPNLSSKTVPSNGFGSGREQLTNPRWPGSSPPT